MGTFHKHVMILSSCSYFSLLVSLLRDRGRGGGPTMYGLILQNMAEYVQNKHGDNMWKKVRLIKSDTIVHSHLGEGVSEH